MDIVDAIFGGVETIRVSEILQAISFSDGLPKLTGYSRAAYAEIVKKDASSLIYPADAQGVIQSFKEACEHGTDVELEFRKLHKDGRIIWVHLQGRKSGEDKGCPLIQCVQQDITRQKQTELELMENKMLYNLAMQYANVNLWTYDINTHTLYETERSGEIHPGKSDRISDFVQTAIANQYVRPDSIEEFKELYRRVEAGESEVCADIWFANSEKNGWWCERIFYTNLKDKDGKVINSIGVGKDITSEVQNQAEQELFQLALSTTSLALCIYDIQNDVFVSHNLSSDRLGLHPEEKEGYKSRLEKGYIMPESRRVYKELYEAVARGEETASALIHYDKRKIPTEWLRITYSRVQDDTGKPILAVATGEDVTSYMKAQQKYNEEMENLEALKSESLLGRCRANMTKNIIDNYICDENVIYTDQTGSYTDAVELIASLCATREMKERYLENMNPENLLRNYRAGRRTISIEYQRKMKNGQLCWVRTSIRSYQNPETGDVMCFMYSYDINEEKRMAMIVSRILDLEYEFLGLVTLQTNMLKCYRHTMMEEFMKVGVDAPYDYGLKEYVESYILPEYQNSALEVFSIEQILKELETKQSFSSSFPVLFHGEKHYKKWMYMYLDENHDVLIMIRTDNTSIIEQQEKQQMMLKTALEQARQASVAKSEFLSRMSHEIRTPMNAIIGMSALAAQCVNEPEKVADFLSKVGLSARFLLSLINDILDMSRIESGRITLKKEEIFFEEFINGVNTIAYELASNKGVEYDCVMTTFTEQVYIGDAMKLQQILMNLLANAVKFTPAGGKVQLLISQEKRDTTAQLRFAVADTGIGISEAFKEKMFEPFEQEQTGSTSPYGGTGLGLAICKNLTEMMNGTISVTSIEGVGSEFIVEVPLGLSEEAVRQERIKNDLNWSSLKVLIVDDEILICEQTQRIFEEMGTKAEWVDSGQKAVETVKERWKKGDIYDIILVDWKMPDMDGIETARQIRKIVGPDVTIIIITAYDWSVIETQAKSAGVNMLISKPVFKSSLCSAFEKIYYQKEQEEQRQIPREYDFNGRRVLLVEDHFLNIEVAKRLLNAKGCEVEVAENGLAAIETFTLAPLGHFDAILMDIRMPVMDGLTAAKSIRQLKKESARTIPIIAMSANAFDEDVEKSKKAGMDAHLAKPIEPELLYATLQNYFERTL